MIKPIYPQQRALLKKKKTKKRSKKQKNNYFPSLIGKNLQQVKAQIQKAAIKSRRSPNKITIVAVTKSFPLGIWDSALKHHLTIIGESRIQEAEQKSNKFDNKKKIELHLIGHLQTNKARKAVQLFDVIETVDSLRLAKRINTISNQEEKIQKIFLQVNTGRDPDKHGFSPKETMMAAKEIADMKNISLIGIMTIPPNNISHKKLENIYSETRKIRDTDYRTIEKQCNNLSMGMSNDYQIAIAEGATHIRLGTALFGKRN